MAKLHPQTGPVTAEGKQVSSRNATTHGGTSENLALRVECHEISSKREEAQAQLVIARVQDALDQREQAQWKAACNGFECPTVVQKIMVHAMRDGTLTEFTPSNDAILRQLDRQSPYPPEEVYRKFEFPQGMPSEYHCFTDREDYRCERGHTIEQWISLDNWRELPIAKKSSEPTTPSPRRGISFRKMRRFFAD